MTSSQPLIAAAIIVKNESEHLLRCLTSIRELCDEIIVVDTGSTDNTVEIAEQFATRVLHKEWKQDFAASRNFALDAVTATWVLYVDADEELVMEDVMAIRQMVAQADDVMAFGLRMHSQVNWTPYYDYRLFRLRDDIRFVGEIHESTMDDIMRVAHETNRRLEITTIDILHHGYEGDLTAKHHRNLPLVLAELKVHPEKINLWNHLGRIQTALGRPDLAEQAFQAGITHIEQFGPRTQFDVQIYASLVDFLITQRRDATVPLDQGMALDPTLKTFQWLYARHYANVEKYDEAIVIADELIAIGTVDAPQDGVAYNLDMFTVWPQQLKIDCLYQLMKFDEVTEQLTMPGEDFPPGSHRRKQLDVCEAVSAWRNTDVVNPGITGKVELNDVTIVMPVRIESADRLANVLAFTQHLRKSYSCRILIGSEAPESLRALLPPDIEIISIDSSPDQAFHMTRVINEVSRHTNSSIRIHCDTDSLIPIPQVIAAVEMIRRGEADMIIPFSFAIGIPQSERDSFAQGQLELGRVVRPRPMIGVPPGLCQVWSAEAFERAGTENEFMIGWAPEDPERLERLSKLDMRVKRISGPAFHLDHQIAPNRNAASEFHAMSQTEYERIQDLNREDLEQDIASWPWRQNVSDEVIPPFNATDLTMIIPMRIDSSDRLRNVILCTKSILSVMDCRILVAIGDPSLLVGKLDSRVEILKVSDPPDRAFERTRIINDAAHCSTSKNIAVVDTDIVLSRDQWKAALETLRTGVAQLVYPYDGRMIEVPYAAHSWLERGQFDRIPINSQQIIEAICVGGCFLFDRETFLRYGMENQKFVSWGFEDDERILRAHKLGVKVKRLDGPIYHVAHHRGPDSRVDNPFIQSNAAEVQRIKRLSNAHLKLEVATWPWVQPPRNIKVLLWNDVWHPDHLLVDPSVHDVELIRDRSRLDECEVIVAGLPTLLWDDLPADLGQMRVLVTREAEANVPGLADEKITGNFDVIASHQRSSDIWVPYIRTDLGGELPDILAPEQRYPVLASAWISSDWNASRRVELLSDLMLHMEIDSYGRILNNVGDVKIGPHHDRFNIASRYRFYLAFENAREIDYVTEKFFEPLMFGAVPVYWGAPNIEDFAPGDHCYIDASRFDSARELAEFLTAMSDDEYLTFHEWRKLPRRESFMKLAESAGVPILNSVLASIRESRQPNPG